MKRFLAILLCIFLLGSVSALGLVPPTTTGVPPPPSPGPIPLDSPLPTGPTTVFELTVPEQIPSNTDDPYEGGRIGDFFTQTVKDVNGKEVHFQVHIFTTQGGNVRSLVTQLQPKGPNDPGWIYDIGDKQYVWSKNGPTITNFGGGVDNFDISKAVLSGISAVTGESTDLLDRVGDIEKNLDKVNNHINTELMKQEKGTPLIRTSERDVANYFYKQETGKDNVPLKGISPEDMTNQVWDVLAAAETDEQKKKSKEELDGVFFAAADLFTEDLKADELDRVYDYLQDNKDLMDKKTQKTLRDGIRKTTTNYADTLIASSTGENAKDFSKKWKKEGEAFIKNYAKIDDHLDVKRAEQIEDVIMGRRAGFDLTVGKGKGKIEYKNFEYDSKTNTFTGKTKDGKKTFTLTRADYNPDIDRALLLDENNNMYIRDGDGTLSKQTGTWTRAGNKENAWVQTEKKGDKVIQTLHEFKDSEEIIYTKDSETGFWRRRVVKTIITKEQAKTCAADPTQLVCSLTLSKEEAEECEKNPKEWCEATVFFDEYSGEESVLLADLRAAQTKTFWKRAGLAMINPVDIVANYEKYKGIVELFYDDEKVEKRRKNLRNQICKRMSPYLVGECATQTLCKSELADIEKVGGTAIISTRGSFTAAVHIEGERSTADVYINETSGEVYEGGRNIIYRVTWKVSNVLENPNGYNVVFKNDGVERYRLYDKFKLLNASASDSRPVSSPFIQYSQNEYDEVCIDMQFPMEVRLSARAGAARKIDMVCNTIVDITGASPNAYAQNGGAGSVGQPGENPGF